MGEPTVFDNPDKNDPMYRKKLAEETQRLYKEDSNRKLINRLEGENAALETKNAELKERVAELEKYLEEIKTTCTDLSEPLPPKDHDPNHIFLRGKCEAFKNIIELIDILDPPKPSGEKGEADERD